MATASSYNFDDIYNDFLATTGINVNDALNKSGYSDLGWVKHYKYMGEGDSRAARSGRYSFQHQKWAGGTGPQTSGGMFGEATSPVFSQDLFDSAGARVASYGSQRFLADRQATDQGTFENWTRESSLYQAKVEQALQSANLQDEAFTQMQIDLDAARAGIADSASKSSSMGAYSQAAKRQMQATQRTIAELSGAKAPQAMEAEFTFTDPVTGKKLDLTTEFDEASAYNGLTTMDDARRLVTDTYTTRRDAIVEDLWSSMNKDAAFDPSLMADSESDFRKSYDAAASAYQSHLDDVKNRRASKMYDYEMLTDDFTLKAFQDAQNIIDSQNEIFKFAEYRTLAEMSGGTEGYFSETFQGEGTAISGTQALMRAEDYDINKVLEDMAFDTQARFEIADLTGIDRTRDEFNRRRDLAASTATDIQRRNELNKTRQQSLLEEKRKYEMSLEQQKQEYASTLASYGASESDDGSISFSDIRPQ